MFNSGKIKDGFRVFKEPAELSSKKTNASGEKIR